MVLNLKKQCLQKQRGKKGYKYMRIYISYSSGSSIAYCFWKYFFRACGVWVTSEKIEKNWRLDKTHKPHLVILDNATRMKYESPSSNIVYCVQRPAKSDQERKDFVCRWADMYHNVIRELLQGNENLFLFMELVDVFGGDYDCSSETLTAEGLWSAAWLFHEIAQRANKEEWDKEIIQKAEKAFSLLQKGNGSGWHKEYMKLYCRYLQCGVNRSSVNTMYQCKKLLEQCADLAKEEDYPMLDYMIAKIRLLTATENKYSVNYLKKAINYEAQPEMLYEIGHVYEKAYGDYYLAMNYYQKAYQLDTTYYRALYKFAVKLEESKDWMRAISVYDRVRQLIHAGRLKNDIGVRDYEYEFKSCRRMMRLCGEYMGDSAAEQIFKERIEDMKRNPEKYVSLKKMFEKMYLKDNQHEKELEIREELYNKLRIECKN